MNSYYPCPFANKNMYRDPDPETMPADFSQFIYPQNRKEGLQLIKESVSGEREDELFYDYLISVAPTDEAKNIIMGIRDDERKHNKLLRMVYKQLTGKTLPPPEQPSFERPRSYCAGIKKAIKGEVGAVIRYRKILYSMQDRVYMNILIEIMTDEIRHASLYNLLYTMGKC